MKKYDLNNLTKEEAMKLIRYEKNPENVMEYQEIYNQIISTLVYETGTYRCTLMVN